MISTNAKLFLNGKEFNPAINPDDIDLNTDIDLKTATLHCSATLNLKPIDLQEFDKFCKFLDSLNNQKKLKVKLLYKHLQRLINKEIGRIYIGNRILMLHPTKDNEVLIIDNPEEIIL